MIVEFWLRTPGEHTIAHEAVMDAVPRVGEEVSLDGQGVHLVHTVTYIIPENRVRVLLLVHDHRREEDK